MSNTHTYLNGWKTCRTTGRKTRVEWTKNDCKKAASRYESRTAFQRYDIRPYSAAYKNGWLDEVCAHMEPIGSRRTRFVYEIQALNSTVVYVGLSYNPRSRYKTHTRSRRPDMRELIDGPHEFRYGSELPLTEAMEEERRRIKKYIDEGRAVLNISSGGAVGGSYPKWTKERCAAAARRFQTRGAFQKASGSAYQAAQYHGWLVEICSHMAPVRAAWTFDRCMAEARKYHCISDMLKGSHAALSAIRRNGWQAATCSHMIPKIRYWTFEDCAAEARKYSSRTDFENGNNAAHQSARYHGWIDAICAHMPRRRKIRDKRTTAITQFS